MAKSDEYLDEAYQTLLKLSADDKKRLEYKAREKALHNQTTQIENAEKRGQKQGEEIGLKHGEEIGIALTRKIFKLDKPGTAVEEIAQTCGKLQEGGT